MVKITSAYAAGYAWSEVFEEDTGTWTVLTSGRQSGSGVWPRAFELNGGQADLTNAIVELDVSQDQDNGATTVGFDGKAIRVAANDKPALSANPTFSAGTLTIPYNIFEFDIKGRNTGVTSANRTVAITAGGGVDLENDTVVAKAGASFINIPTTNGSTTILEFVANGGGGDMRLKGSTQYKVIIGGAANWEIGYVKFH